MTHSVKYFVCTSSSNCWSESCVPVFEFGSDVQKWPLAACNLSCCERRPPLAEGLEWKRLLEGKELQFVPLHTVSHRVRRSASSFSHLLLTVQKINGLYGLLWKSSVSQHLAPLSLATAAADGRFSGSQEQQFHVYGSGDGNGNRKAPHYQCLLRRIVKYGGPGVSAGRVIKHFLNFICWYFTWTRLFGEMMVHKDISLATVLDNVKMQLNS